MAEQRIPHSRLTLSRRSQLAAMRVLKSGQLAGGKEVAKLEAAFAKRFGFAYAVAVSNGTAGLHLALLALGIQPGERVLAPSYVCVAVLNAIRYIGAREKLLDLAPGSFHALATREDRRGIAAAIVPHLFGYASDLASFHGLPVVEDCAMSLGAEDLRGQPLGHRGVAAVHSFYATKMVAAGEGGMVGTNDARFAAAVRDLREYDKKDEWRLRFNYKLTDLQAAVARAELATINQKLARRRQLAHDYAAALATANLQLPPMTPGASFHRFVIRSRGFVGTDPIAGFRRCLIDVARPVHRPIHQLLGLAEAGFRRTEDVFLTALSLPLYPDLTRAELLRVAGVTARLTDH